ncbi:MAG: hypothetical protein EA376_01955 [Phycisphaeraceae bacterium]|nr:MAG: hypothetical protein EA376_01955 [Phycisphaeraceae bacterium]
MTGGVRSVDRTDFLQFPLAFVGSIIYAWIVVGEAGGPGALTQHLTDLFPVFLVIISLQWLFLLDSEGAGYPSLAQHDPPHRQRRRPLQSP